MDNYCEYIHKLFSSLRCYSHPFEAKTIPLNGIYVLFENGEFAHSSKRIVRIGTHTGDNNLPSRIKEHFLKENKDRSIFRKNIGKAILNKNNDPFITYWEIDLTDKEEKEKYSKIIDKEKQKNVEKMVTDYIQSNISFILIKVNDKTHRLSLESKIISTISWCNDCKQTENWLGNHSPVEKIVKSGLWVTNGLWKDPLNENDIQFIEQEVY